MKPKKHLPYQGVRNKLPGETNAQARDRRFREAEERALRGVFDAAQGVLDQADYGGEVSLAALRTSVGNAERVKGKS